MGSEELSEFRAYLEGQEALPDGYIRCLLVNMQTKARVTLHVQSWRLKFDASIALRVLEGDGQETEECRMKALLEAINELMQAVTMRSAPPVCALLYAIGVLDHRVMDMMGGAEPRYVAAITDGRTLQFAGGDSADEFNDAVLAAIERSKKSRLQ